MARRNAFNTLVYLFCVASLISCGNLRPTPSDAEVAALHERLVTIDTHVDIPKRFGFGDADPGREGPMQYDLDKMRAGGIDGAFYIVFTRQGELSKAGYLDAFLAAMQRLDAIRRMTYRYGAQIALASTPDEFERNRAAGKLSAMIGIENGYPLGANLEHLKVFAQRGASYVSITHDGNNQLGISARPKPGETGADTGLTATGRELVRELNSLGIMVDVSHASQQSTVQAAQLSRAPVIASHSSAAGVFDHARNLSDIEIQAIAAGGGVVQVVAFDAYLRDINADNRAAIEKAMQAAGFDGPGWHNRSSQAEVATLRASVKALGSQWPRASVGDLVDHIDYIVDLVGIEHVGIASDFGGGGGIAGWDHAGESAAVTAELMRRGYTETDIGKIWGGNLLRVWREVVDLGSGA